MNVKISHIIETYKKLSIIPSPVSAVICPGKNDSEYSVHTAWTNRDLLKAELTCFARQYALQRKEEKLGVTYCGYAIDTSSVALNAFSKTGKQQAILRKQGKLTDDHQFLEIWNSSRKKITFDMHDRKEHGKIYDNNHFGCLEWSHNEKSLLYVAEMSQPKSELYFSDTSSLCHGDNLSDATSKEEGVYREDWGEALVGVHHPVICILEAESGSVEVLTLEKCENITIGQAIWGPQDETIVFVGWKESPRRLGLQYCTNRRSAIYVIDLKTREINCISGDGDISVRSPRFSPGYDTLIYLQNRAGGPHHMGSKIVKYHWEMKQLSTVVDIVENVTDNQFPGVYIDNLPTRCWSEDGKYIFFSSPWRSRQVIIGVNVENSSVEQVCVDECFGRCDVLDVKKDILIVSVSSPNIEPCLIAGHLQRGDKLSITWTYLDLSTPVKLLGINWTIIALEPTKVNETYSKLDYEVILLTPEGKRDDVPLILWPHGGPHSVFVAGYQIFAAGFAKLGYAVCMVNYRGSIGFGESSIKSLLGNVGVQDVQDVQDTAEYLRKKSGLNIAEFLLFGGSHGGFLVAHLSGQYPDYYKACIMRNPVIDISAMVEGSDIPDWSWVETGHGDQFSFSSIVTPEVATSMWEKSPIKYMNKVTIPTLILLGKKDLRVPPSQGLKYYHHLKARNIPVRLYYYDDNHALSKAAIEGDCFIQATLWLKKHLLPN